MGVNKIVLALSGLSVLIGCSSFYSSKEYSALHIKPVMNVQHADTSAENLYHLGRYHHRRTSYANAIAAYQKALAINPDYVEAHNGLGVIYSTQGQYALALEHFKKAIELTPAATYLYNNLGYVHLLQGQNSEAVMSFEEALRYDPHNQKASRNLATAHKRMGRVEGIAIFSPATKNPEEITPLLPQIPTAQKASQQPQLVQVAPNVYEFTSDHEKPQRAPIAAPVAEPITASPTLTSIHLTPINHERNEGIESTVSDNSVSAGPAKRIEVSNGNGVTGMARDIATYLKQFGFDNARLTNHQTFQQAQTEIHYHPSAQTLAERINQLMPSQVRITETTELREDVHLKILLGKDIANEMAHFNKQDNIQLAQSLQE